MVVVLHIEVASCDLAVWRCRHNSGRVNPRPAASSFNVRKCGNWAPGTSGHTLHLDPSGHVPSCPLVLSPRQDQPEASPNGHANRRDAELCDATVCSTFWCSQADLCKLTSFGFLASLLFRFFFLKPQITSGALSRLHGPTLNLANPPPRRNGRMPQSAAPRLGQGVAGHSTRTQLERIHHVSKCL